jgi:hypothetical protein
MQQEKAFIWLQGGAYKNNPAGYFSERASWRRVNFSLQSKKIKRVHIIRKKWICYYSLSVFWQE